MKKRLCYLIAALMVISAGKANALDVSSELARDAGGAYNKMQLEQIDGYKLEKSYIHSLDHITKDESIYDASIEENVAREGVLYNPHFLLEKINFEGNTQISEEELTKLALEVLGEDIFFDELFASKSNVVVVAMQDMLGLGSDYRMNIPSVPNGNWSYQMKQGEFDDKLVARFAKLNKKYGR